MTSKMPSKVSYGCYDYSVLKLSNEQIKKFIGSKGTNSYCGAVNIDGQLIVMNKSNTEQMNKLTMLHELGHIIVRKNDIGQDLIIDEKAEEDVVDKMASGLIEVLRRNPQLTKWLLSN